VDFCAGAESAVWAVAACPIARASSIADERRGTDGLIMGLFDCVEGDNVETAV
jgi:hypothetical protein